MKVVQCANDDIDDDDDFSSLTTDQLKLYSATTIGLARGVAGVAKKTRSRRRIARPAHLLRQVAASQLDRSVLLELPQPRPIDRPVG